MDYLSTVLLPCVLLLAHIAMYIWIHYLDPYNFNTAGTFWQRLSGGLTAVYYDYIVIAIWLIPTKIYNNIVRGIMVVLSVQMGMLGIYYDCIFFFFAIKNFYPTFNYTEEAYTGMLWDTLTLAIGCLCYGSAAIHLMSEFVSNKKAPTTIYKAVNVKHQHPITQ